MIPHIDKLEEFSSLKDLNMYPILYLQEHYPLLVKMLTEFPTQKLPEKFKQGCNSEIYLKEFAHEIENTILEAEEKSHSSLNLVNLY